MPRNASSMVVKDSIELLSMILDVIYNIITLGITFKVGENGDRKKEKTSPLSFSFYKRHDSLRSGDRLTTSYQ
jgi:hypothetical protein